MVVEVEEHVEVALEMAEALFHHSSSSSNHSCLYKSDPRSTCTHHSLSNHCNHKTRHHHSSNSLVEVAEVEDMVAGIVDTVAEGVDGTEQRLSNCFVVCVVFCAIVQAIQLSLIPSHPAHFCPRSIQHVC